MARLDRVYELHRLLRERRVPVPLTELCDSLECSTATVKRTIRFLRTYFDAEVLYDRDLNGYHLDRSDGRSVELPGIWLSPEELQALLVLQESIERLSAGLLEEQLAPLARQLERLMRRRGLDPHQASRRVRILSMATRAPGSHFREITAATLDRRRLVVLYRPRAGGEIRRRTLSPQRVTRYRGNWYLDAWCHWRGALRSFAFERLREVAVTSEPARDIPDEELDRFYADAYGIFSGPATDVAVLVFSPERARWVAEETWHPRQEGRWRDDGCYELRLPFGRADELVLDVLRYGDEVEVEAPAALRAEVGRRHAAAAARYGDEKKS
jgi:predicted DNA-binding transcriptional regulator YafY